MGFIRPATPGFIVTLVATILLAVVSFCVPYFKTIYFLKATITEDGISGSITFGTLGYCLELSNGTTCSKPSVGYELDINGLVGDKLPIKIPQVVVKWVTYALVLHIVALALAGGSAIFGLLAHIREMSMTCCSTCISGFAAAVALLAFIFDLAFFFIAKARINAVAGGSATIGNAIWLTLAAWILLFFSGCFYTLGRCCISNRGNSRQRGWDKMNGDREAGPNRDGYAERMRLDAVKAEADRKTRQLKAEGGLPAFQEYEPLQKTASSDDVHLMNDDSNEYDNVSGGASRQPAGYAQAPPGTRAVDEYYNPTRDQAGSTYPPQPQRQNSGHTLGTSTSGYTPTSYAPSTYGYTAPPPAPANQYLATYGDSYNAPNQYGHTAGGTTYDSTASHQQYPTNYDSYGAQAAQHSQHGLNPGSYDISSQPFNAPHSHDRLYTLGGGYGGTNIPSTNQAQDLSYFPYPGDGVVSASPAPMNTRRESIPTSPVKGPRAMTSPVHQPFDDSPPRYDPGF